MDVLPGPKLTHHLANMSGLQEIAAQRVAHVYIVEDLADVPLSYALVRPSM